MTIGQIKELLSADLLVGEEHINKVILSACGADLMSDVLAFAKEKGILLTGLINPQVVRTAEMMDLKAIVFVRGKSPTPEIIELAKENDMSVLTTGHPMFVACGLLYANGLIGGETV